MKTTASTFIQYIQNNKPLGFEKVVGFYVEGQQVTLKFSKLPTVKEWVELSAEWYHFSDDPRGLNIKTLWK